MSALLTLCSALFVVSCGGEAPTKASLDSAGAVGLALQVSPGNSVTSATYTITGPNGYASAGTVPVGESPDVPVVVQHLPNGTGYEMDVSGTASDGLTTCDGSVTFDIVNNATATVLVHLSCGVPSGDVLVTSTLNICPMLDSLSANPTSIVVGGSTALTTAAHDTDNGPSPLSYQWSANGANLHSQVPNLTFACSSPGDVIIKVSVSDGDNTAGCPDSLSVPIHCELP